MAIAWKSVCSLNGLCVANDFNFVCVRDKTAELDAVL